MKPTERDDLLSRLDERTNNIWRAVEKIEQHSEAQNGFIQECMSNLASNKSAIKANRWAITISITTIATILGTHFTGLW